MKMMNGKPCMKCGGKVKYKGGGKYPKMQTAGFPPSISFTPKTNFSLFENKDPFTLSGNKINNPFAINKDGLLSQTKCDPGYKFDFIQNKCIPDPTKSTTLPQYKIENGNLVQNGNFTIPTGSAFMESITGCPDGKRKNIVTGECEDPLSITTTTTYKPRVDPEIALKVINRGVNAISNIVDQSRQAGPDSYLARQLSTLGQRINNPIPWWATNEQKQVAGYDLYTGTVGGNKMKEGGTNMKQSITTQTTEPPYKGWIKKRTDEILQRTWNEINPPIIANRAKAYIPLSEDELSALAHQFRGMGSDKSTYAMIPQGSGIDNIGYLTPRERKQLSDYMNSRNALQSIWEGLPNLLGASGAAALPESSRLIKDRIMRNSYFPGNTGYTDWLNYMQSQGYKLGGSTNNKTNNMIKIKEENKGKFTAQARKAGMGVQEFANYVLGNPDEFNAATAKRAQFAKNAASWGLKKEYGGVTMNNPYYDAYYQDGGAIPMEAAPMEGGAPGGDQLQQIIQMIIEALQEGMSPQDVLAALVKMGIPQEQATQLLQAVIEKMQGAGGQGQMQGGEGMEQEGEYEDEEMNEQQTAPMMAYGGKSMPRNEGFQALPQYVQEKIMSNMQGGGEMNDQMNMLIKAYAQMKGIDPQKVMEMIQQELESGAQLNTILKSLQMEMQQNTQSDQTMMRMGGMNSNYK